MRSCSFHTCGSGSSKMARSVSSVDTAFAIHVPTWLMQRPGISGYHTFCTGTQMKTNRNVMQTPQAITNPPMRYAHRRKYAKWKMR